MSTTGPSVAPAGTVTLSVRTPLTSGALIVNGPGVTLLNFTDVMPWKV